MPSNEYMRQYMATRRANRLATLKRMSNDVCAKCGEPGEEFNHLERKEKLFGLDSKGMDRPWESILAEWGKCEFLCRVCHLEYTAGQYARGEIRPWNARLSEPLVHATSRCYNEMPCRCAPCKAAKRAYRNKMCRYDEQWPVTQ